jgi:hypothetical protein
MARNYYRNSSTVALCSLKVEPCEAASVNLGEEYGRCNQSRKRTAAKVYRGTGAKRKVGRPNRLVLGELHYKSI